MDLILCHRPNRGPERSYIYNTLLREFLGIEFRCEQHAEPHLAIRAGGHNSQELIIDDTFLGLPDPQWLQTESLPQFPIPLWTPDPELSRPLQKIAEKLPVLYGTPLTGNEYFSELNGQVRLGLDVFGSSFFFLTRYEEMVIRDRDQFDRFPVEASVAFKGKFLDRPVVNEYVEVLWAALYRAWPALKRKNRRYRVFLTHDIDDLSTLGRSATTIVRSVGADLLIRREPSLAIRKLRAWATTNACGRMIDSDPYNTFDFLMSTSEEVGLRSSFYVISGSSHPYDATYRLDQEWICRLLKDIHQRGHEIGYHASYNTYLDCERTQAEVHYLRRVLRESGIDQEVTGGRQHYLRWANPRTWQNWENSELSYDTTLTFAQRAGFRCGCCYEYPVWDLSKRQQLRLRERPLIIMERSLLAHERLPPSEAECKMVALMNTCRHYEGDFTLLWHNSMVVGKASRKMYRRIVRLAAGVPVQNVQCMAHAG